MHSPTCQRSAMKTSVWLKRLKSPEGAGHLGQEGNTFIPSMRSSKTSTATSAEDLNLNEPYLSQAIKESEDAGLKETVEYKEFLSTCMNFEKRSPLFRLAKQRLGAKFQV